MKFPRVFVWPLEQVKQSGTPANASIFFDAGEPVGKRGPRESCCNKISNETAAISESHDVVSVDMLFASYCDQYIHCQGHTGLEYLKVGVCA